MNWARVDGLADGKLHRTNEEMGIKPQDSSGPKKGILC